MPYLAGRAAPTFSKGFIHPNDQYLKSILCRQNLPRLPFQPRWVKSEIMLSQNGASCEIPNIAVKIWYRAKKQKILNHRESSDDTVRAHTLKAFSKHSSKVWGDYCPLSFLNRETAVLQKRNWGTCLYQVGMKSFVGQPRTECGQFIPFGESKAATHWLKKLFTAINFAQMPHDSSQQHPKAAQDLPASPPVPQPLQPMEKKGWLMGQSAGEYPHCLCHKVRYSRYLSKIIFCCSIIPAIVTLNGQFPSFLPL